jgi:hypothetical protein
MAISPERTDEEWAWTSRSCMPVSQNCLAPYSLFLNQLDKAGSVSPFLVAIGPRSVWSQRLLNHTLKRNTQIQNALLLEQFGFDLVSLYDMCPQGPTNCCSLIRLCLDLVHTVSGYTSGSHCNAGASLHCRTGTTSTSVSFTRLFGTRLFLPTSMALHIPFCAGAFRSLCIWRIAPCILCSCSLALSRRFYFWVQFGMSTNGISNWCRTLEETHRF